MVVFEAGEPLLREYRSNEDATSVTSWTPEDGRNELESLDSPQNRGFIEKMLMAVRRRNARSGKETFDRVRVPLEEKEKSVRREWRMRRCGLKTALGVTLLVFVFL